MDLIKHPFTWLIIVDWHARAQLAGDQMACDGFQTYHRPRSHFDIRPREQKKSVWSTKMTLIYYLFDKTLAIIICECYHLFKQEYNKMARGRPLGKKTSTKVPGNKPLHRSLDKLQGVQQPRRETMKLLWHQELVL